MIEKEPSVYDDDIYDTKTYSDPGSEEYTSQFGAVASEADTYRSDSRHPPAKYLQLGVRDLHQTNDVIL